MFNGTIQPEWIDHNGHTNVAYYVLAFDLATDELYEGWGLGERYPERGYSVYTLGMNVDYRAEMLEGEPFRVESVLVDFDHKRVHYFHQMYRGESDEIVAVNECLATNVDLETRRSADFPPDIIAKLTSVKVDEMPQGFGRKLQIRRKNAA